MTALAVLQAAGEAGLTVRLDGRSLEVRGPQSARQEFLPLVAAQAREIKKLLEAGGLQSVAKCHGRRPEPCPACGYVHGALAEPEPCSVCGSSGWTASVVGMAGDRICSVCFRGS